MLKGRRVGTFTAGISLLGFGILFFIHTFAVNFNYQFVFKLWPVILILLGVEMIVAYLLNKDSAIRYDAGAIVIVIILAMFAMGMGGTEFILEHSRFHNGYWLMSEM